MRNGSTISIGEIKMSKFLVVKELLKRVDFGKVVDAVERTVSVVEALNDVSEYKGKDKIEKGLVGAKRAVQVGKVLKGLGVLK